MWLVNLESVDFFATVTSRWFVCAWKWATREIGGIPSSHIAFIRSQDFRGRQKLITVRRSRVRGIIEATPSHFLSFALFLLAIQFPWVFWNTLIEFRSSEFPREFWFHFDREEFTTLITHERLNGLLCEANFMCQNAGPCSIHNVCGTPLDLEREMYLLWHLKSGFSFE
jgi:hypothetical protein